MMGPSMMDKKREYLDFNASFGKALRVSQTHNARVIILNFKVLQLFRIQSLQEELLKLQKEFKLGGFADSEYPARLNQLDEALNRYCQAIRNYEFLSQSTLDFVPPGQVLFGAPEELIETSVNQTWPSLFDRLLKRPKIHTMQYSIRNCPPLSRTMSQNSLQFREIDAAGSAAREKVHVLERFSFAVFSGALFGGLALMAPVLIMTLHPGRKTALVTCLVAIVLFAFTLTLFQRNVRGNGRDILTATSAYAAVLVVFIGVSGTPANGQ
ncbi:hypothetical protein BDZ45DRAFT_673590 [Acephala macrosclerotiorum]|nr:hypothetical protein BDZ45DRAFT_673590 [Acephala macrosclerotiorum]